MMALENKDTIQKSCEAAINCLQKKGFPCNLKCGGNCSEGFHSLKDEVGAHTRWDAFEPVHSLNGDFMEHPKEFYSKISHQHDYGPWSTFFPDSHKVLPYTVNPFESPICHLPVESRLHYGPIDIITPGYPCDVQFQDFQYFVVIDFEATCDKEKNPHPQEIIEFPSVVVNSITGQLEACFQTYVRPTHHQVLSDFCKDLTGIQQIQVDRGVTLMEALDRHDKWLQKKGIKNTTFAVVTWSNWDCRVILESECRFKNIRKPHYFNRWINLKVPFHDVFGGGRCNLKEAVELAGLSWQGRPHCGLDDAKNTARLVALLMRKGFKLSITNSLIWQAAGGPLIWREFPENACSPPPQRLQNLPVPSFQYHPFCFCGVKSSKGMVRKPGPKQGSVFFGCGNWTTTRGARCHYFKWAGP